MSADEFISDKDADALADMQVFRDGLAANPGLYGVTEGDVAAISAAVDFFGVKLAVVQNPATKTKITVAGKDSARVSAEQICRQFYNLIKPDAGIPVEAKLAIGIKPPNTARNPIPVPASTPTLNYIGAAPNGAQTLRYSDTSSPDSRGKPYGAANLQLWRVIGPAPVYSTAGAEFYGVFTKNPIIVQFTADENGKVCTYFARWCTAKGEPGQWSAPLSTPIVAVVSEAG